MKTRRASPFIAAASLAAASFVFGAPAAAAHGGSVSPPSEQQECRNLALYDKGEGSHGKKGTNTAGEHDSAVNWGHCG